MRSPLCLAVTFVLLAAAAPAGAAGPLAPADLSVPADHGAGCTPDSQPGSGGVDVAVNDAGAAVVSWTRNAGGGAQVVQARVRPAGGEFGPVETLGPTLPCYTFGVAGSTPQAGIDGAGNALVAFAAPSASNSIVRVAQRPAGGSFGPAVDLSQVSVSVLFPQVAVNEAGVAAVAWSARVGARDVVQASIRPAGGAFGFRANLSNVNQDARGPALAINDAGAIAAAWARNVGGVAGNNVVQATVRPAGAAAFVTAQDVTAPTDDAGGARVVVDGGGRPTVGWQRGGVAEARSLSAQGVVEGTADAISEPGEAVQALELGVAADGAVTAAYVSCANGCLVKAGDRPAGERFGATAPISPPVDQSTDLDLAVNPAGAAAVLLNTRFAGDTARLAHRPAGGRFGDVVPLSAGSAFFPALALDGEGTAVGAWTAGTAPTSGTKVTQAAAFDAGAPALTSVEVPAAAAAGAPVRMLAAAADRWSGAALAWDFGDGATGAGGDVTHAYAAPGAYTVTVTATDAAGNARSATRTLQVAGPQPAGAPPALPVIDSPVLTSWAFKGKRFFLLSLRTTRLPARAVAELRCRGKGCPAAKRTFKRIRKRAITLAEPLALARATRKRARTYRAGQTVQVRITAPGFVGKVVTFPLRAGQVPRGRPSCLSPGARTPRACPQ